VAYKSDPRGAAPVRLIAVHTGEGARTAVNLAAFFSRDDAEGSAHAGIDYATTLLMVPYNRASWTLRRGNAISDNVELCAFAEMTRAQWLSEESVTWRHSTLKRNVTVDRPRDMLRRTSAWIAGRCLARNIPIRKLTPAQVSAGWAGVIGHVDWTEGMNDGTHWDPGPNFPWDIVLADARSIAQGDDMPLTKEDLSAIAGAVWGMQLGNGHAQANMTVTNSNTWEIKGQLSTLNVKMESLAGKLDDREAKFIVAVREIVAADADDDVVVGPEHIAALVDAMTAALPEHLRPIVVAGVAEVLRRGVDEE